MAAILFWLARQQGACRPATPAKPAVTAPSQALNLQEAFAQVAEQLKPAVVSITTVHVETTEPMGEFYFGDPFEDFFDQFYGRSPQRRAPQRRQQKVQGMGSGVIIDPKGYVLTNEHVVRDADEISVTLRDPEEKVYKGKVVGKDMRSDLAVVKIEPRGNITHAVLGDSDKVRVGDWSIAVGSPFGLEQTVTVGVISAVRQSLNIDGNNYANLLQTDAAINRGNSGGPLINIHGEVIGINTAIYAPTGVFAGIGFAIPANRAKEIMAQLIEKGRVVRGWMGVEIAPMNEVLAEQFKVPGKDGVIINSVVPDSPADKAGLLRGDVIKEFDGQKIAKPEDLTQLVGRTAPKKKVKLRVIREGEWKDLTLVTGEMPATPEESRPEARAEKEESDSASDTWEGARVVTCTPALARRYGLEGDTRGVLIAQLNAGLAQDIGLQEGDLVLSVNRQATPNASAFVRAMKKADLESGLLMDINRQGRRIYVTYRKGD